MTQLSEEERWVLSFYRDSEISGAMFFARIARYLPAGPIQRDMTRHFADESQHADLWTKALYNLDAKPIRCQNAYQDAYLEAAGLPVNLMEILALTNVFEKRALKQYSQHLRLKELNPIIGDTLRTIMEDEKWHIMWVNRALNEMVEQFGKDVVEQKLAHYKRADEEVYAKAVAENSERLQFLFNKQIDNE